MEINVCEEDIQVSEGEARVSSLAVAKRFGKRHDHILRAIDNLEVNQEFRLLNFGESKYLNTQGKEQRMILMTKDGFVLLSMGLTGKDIMVFKLSYIAAFNKMEAFIRDHHLPDSPPLLEWHQARLEGKAARRIMTDVIKNELIPHAISSGSKNAGKYYIHYSKLMDLFKDDKDFKAPAGTNLRDCLCVTDLALFRRAEERMCIWIHDEIVKGTYYKDIYQKCKERMLSVVELLGVVKPSLPPKSPVPALSQNKPLLEIT